ncbi:MAG TPA: DEAD/DEAH box helicase [Acidimicrobiia bacterium]
MALERFSEAARAWFDASFAAPTSAQTMGWEAIARGDHTLIHAPTGSGKTLAAFLWAIDRLASEPPPEERRRCRVLYVSPMKALAYDVERNLRAPLTGIQLAAEWLGAAVPAITTAMRTGDTPPGDRQAMVRHPPDILITTPESLYLMLTSQARGMLESVRWVIVDEIHSIAGTKRGSHLSISLERLSEITEVEPQRIGLSATQRPLERIAEFLGGGTLGDGAWAARPVTVVDAPWEKQLDVEIVVPVEDMTRPEETPVPDAVEEGSRRSIWPAMYPRLLDLVLDHTSTLLFVNSRGLAERLAAELNRLAGSELVQSHHGSVSREQRLTIENRLKRGELRGVVATSTLELGIDMAAIDLVVLVESPASVARALQRVGRAGHQVGAASVAKVFPKHRGDLLETAVVVERMHAGAIEETTIPRNPLDVLAQHVVAAVSVEPRSSDGLYELVRRAAPYRDLPRSSFDAVLDMLSGRYPSDEFAELRPRLVWDRVEDRLEGRGNAQLLAVTNPGTIPDRGLYTVTLPDGGRVGELDEEMVYESRPGEVFVLGSTSWKVSEITQDKVVVTPAPADAAAKMPFWHGDGPGRPLELGKAIGAFIREIGALDPARASDLLEERYRLDPWAARNLAHYFEEEKAATGVLPSDRTIVVERFRDEIGDWRVALLSPFGARVHAPWALAARRRYRDANASEVDVLWSDDGIMFRFPDVDTPPSSAEILITAEEIEELVLEEVGDSALFASRFREAAARALLLPRRRPGARTPLWLQRRKAANLLEVARQYGSFPVILETYREVLQDHFDLPALQEVLGAIAKRTVRVREVDLHGPSPFASSLMFDFIASFMYEYDAPLAEKRAAALTLDRSLLQELLGEPEFRDLLDADVIAAVERELQRLADGRKIGTPDQLHDALNDLGPLTRPAIEARLDDPATADGWLTRLIEARRVVPIRFGGEDRIAAVEDLARLRDAVGISPPRGVAPSLLEPVLDPLGDVVGRYARTHGPFAVEAAASELRLPPAAVAEVLHRLRGQGRVSAGAYRPGRSGQEWVDNEVLRRIRRRSLAVLRREVEAVEPAAYAGYLAGWHGIGQTTGRRDRIFEVVRQLQGCAVPASTLESEILPSRMDYEPAILDNLLASGDVMWMGRGPLGAADGRVALYLREQAPLLHWPLDGAHPDGELHDRLRTHLRERGASFFRDLYAAAEGGDPGVVLDALWDLVWSGEVTNDTMAPLRAFLWGRAKRRSGGKPQLSAATPPAGSGRWYLAVDVLDVPPAPSPEQAAKAIAEQLLERHGIVTRDAALSESIPGGFAGLYPVFAALEDAGRVRRGYFVEGQGGAQFGLPGAIDRLRSRDARGIVILSAVDPANPYGASLPWPGHPEKRPARRAGSQVVLNDGGLIAWIDRGGRTAVTFDEPDAGLVAAALADAFRRRGGRSALESVDGATALGSWLAPHLEAAGFAVGYRGFTLRSRHPSRA